MEPNLSSEVIAGLKRLGNPTLVNEDVFLKLVRNVTSNLGSSKDSLNSVNFSKEDLMKEAEYALLSLLLEVARLDISSESLHTFIQSKVNWSKSRSQSFCDCYAAASPRIISRLSTVGFHPPHIVDVRWSLNHCIKASCNEHSSTSLVALSLDTEGLACTNQQSPVNFFCTVPELQDLVSKLKEALRQMDHVVQLSHE